MFIDFAKLCTDSQMNMGNLPKFLGNRIDCGQDMQHFLFWPLAINCSLKTRMHIITHIQTMCSWKHPQRSILNNLLSKLCNLLKKKKEKKKKNVESRLMCDGCLVATGSMRADINPHWCMCAHRPMYAQSADYSMICRLSYECMYVSKTKRRGLDSGRK